MSAAVTVVFVAFNSAAVLGEAIASVPEGMPVVVVDNASRDVSVEVARQGGAEVIEAGENLGFGAGCNLGVRAVETQFVLFLNPDARLLPDTVELLMEDAEANPNAAAFGPLLLDNGVPELPRAYTLLEDGPAMMDTLPEEPCEPGFLSGACLLMRRSAFEAVGGFDEAIFLYLEDDDLCLRLRQAGSVLRLVPGAQVVHHQGTSSPPSRRSLKLRNHHTMASHVYLAKKHGLSVDFEAMRLNSRQRLKRAWLTLDLKRIAINRGRLSGLSATGPGKQT